jgi:hypothetical protein
MSLPHSFLSGKGGKAEDPIIYLSWKQEWFGEAAGNQGWDYGRAYPNDGVYFHKQAYLNLGMNGPSASSTLVDISPYFSQFVGTSGTHSSIRVQNTATGSDTGIFSASWQSVNYTGSQYIFGYDQYKGDYQSAGGGHWYQGLTGSLVWVTIAINY